MIYRASFICFVLCIIVSASGCKRKQEEGKPQSVHKVIRKINPVDGATMVYIPAGSYFMGSNTGFPDEKPVHKVTVKGFYMYEKPVTNRQYSMFMKATGHSPPVNIEGKDSRYTLWKEGVCPPEISSQPIINVSWYDAVCYADWAGVRLPTEEEWERAARGGIEQKEYPWGDDPPSPQKALFEEVWNGTETLSKAGSYKPNPYGLYDMAGCVWEWCINEYYPDIYGSNEEEVKEEGAEGMRSLRGGSWLSKGMYIRCSSRNAADPRFGHDNIGFRPIQLVK